MKKLGKKKICIWLIIAAIIVIVCAVIWTQKDTTDLKSIKSKKELLRFYEDYDGIVPIIARAVTAPFSEVFYIVEQGTMNSGVVTSSTTTETNSITKYSTTNTQVENVDEADITKTDGDYIYSISDDNVIITNVMDPTNIKVQTTIEPTDEYIPEELLLYEDKLVVISTQYINYNKSNTYVNIYDITIKSKPKLIECFTIYEKYYTSRCIDGKLIVISNGELRKEQNEIVTYYEENNIRKEIDLDNIKYLKELKTSCQTIIACYNLNKVENIKINSYLLDIENAYISTENMYLLREEYEDETPSLKELFGIEGVIGFVKKMLDFNYYSECTTNIYKFGINNDGEVAYKCKTEVEGYTINQFSLDEYNENLRIGLYTSEGSRIAILDNKLNLIGETQKLAAGEKMYSTRFVGDRAYMVTYKTIDPLFVIDLSDEENPQVLGKLKIPGYSTYLQPYDENHIIGIGMQTKEKVNRNSSGKIISTTAEITGMKMALFDITDFNNPIQISETIIGDKRTTSAVLTNHKALLFDKEKEIIAIPVNNYKEDFEISSSSENIETIENLYKNYSKEYVSEGYFVYDVNLEEGFKLKGTITHENTSTTGDYYKNSTKLLRGLWIEDNLYTISENMIKVNKLTDLSEIDTIIIK